MSAAFGGAEGSKKGLLRYPLSAIRFERRCIRVVAAALLWRGDQAVTGTCNAHASCVPGFQSDGGRLRLRLARLEKLTSLMGLQCSVVQCGAVRCGALEDHALRALDYSMSSILRYLDTISQGKPYLAIGS